MVLNLHIPDSLYNEYLGKHGTPGLYHAMKEAITAYKDVKKGDRSLLLHGEGRQKVEAIFETTLDDAKKLERLVKNLCLVKIAGVEVTMTSDQLARCDMQAKFHGRTTEVYIQETVKELLARFMEEI